jgi:hypothetical protein
MPSQPSSPNPDRAARAHGQIAEDHHDLKQALVELRHTSELRLLIPQLTRLRAELKEHFDLEEGEDGLAQAIGESAPHHLNRLTKLFEEHVAMLEAVDGIIKRAEDCLDGPVREVFRDVTGLCRHLEEHEANETQLLTDAVFTDLGTSG